MFEVKIAGGTFFKYTTTYNGANAQALAKRSGKLMQKDY